MHSTPEQHIRDPGGWGAATGRPGRRVKNCPQSRRLDQPIPAAGVRRPSAREHLQRVSSGLQMPVAADCDRPVSRSKPIAGESMIQRRWFLSVLAVLLFGLGGWLALHLAGGSSSVDDRLVGAWNGSGTMTMKVKPNALSGSDVPGGEALESVQEDVTVQARFLADGTYRWREQHRGGVTFDFQIPIHDELLPKWQVIRSAGDELVLRYHRGERPLEFHGNDAFTLHFTDEEMNGDLLFKRTGAALGVK